MADNDEIARQLERLADEQRRTADMLESLVYLEAAEDNSQIAFGKTRGYWKAEPPWD